MKEPLAALIERCRRREEDAMAELVSRFRNWALDLANALLDDASLAEDAVQEAFTTAPGRGSRNTHVIKGTCHSCEQAAMDASYGDRRMPFSVMIPAIKCDGVTSKAGL